MGIVRFIRKLMPEKIVEILRNALIYNRFKPYLISKEIGEYNFGFWIGDPTGEKWYDFKEKKLSEEMIFIHGMIDSDERIIEAGPHHGLMTILMAKWANKGKVLALEALPHNTDILKKNITQNGLENVTVENKAVGDENGYTYIRGGSNSSIASGVWGGAHKVEMTTLDNYIDFKPTMIKIDIEGFEFDALEGASKILETTPKLAIELHVRELRERGIDPAEVLNFIDRDKYEIWLQSDGTSTPEIYDESKIPDERQVHIYALP